MPLRRTSRHDPTFRSRTALLLSFSSNSAPKDKFQPSHNAKGGTSRGIHCPEVVIHISVFMSFRSAGRSGKECEKPPSSGAASCLSQRTGPARGHRREVLGHRYRRC